MKKSHIIKKSDSDSSDGKELAYFFSRIFCIFKNAVKNARLTLLWMAEMSVVYHRLGWACSLRRDFR